jgi:hypothetical protein
MAKAKTGTVAKKPKKAKATHGIGRDGKAVGTVETGPKFVDRKGSTTK